MRRLAPIPAVVLTGLALAAPARAADAVYGGHLGTADDAIVLTADRAAQHLKSTVVAFAAPCRGSDPTPRLFHKSVAVVAAKQGTTLHGVWRMTRNAGGRFAGTYTLPATVGENGLLLTMKLSGRLTRASASGALSATWTLTGADGKVVETCATGTRRLAAQHRPGLVYAGRTTQDEPFVVRLARDRLNVDDVDVGWHADCDADHWVDIPETFVDFPLSATGRFGDTFTQRYPNISGSGENVYDYTLAGVVGRRSASGTFRAAARYPDGLSCDTRVLRWKAAST